MGFIDLEDSRFIAPRIATVLKCADSAFAEVKGYRSFHRISILGAIAESMASIHKIADSCAVKVSFQEVIQSASSAMDCLNWAAEQLDHNGDDDTDKAMKNLICACQNLEQIKKHLHGHIIIRNILGK